MTAIWRKGMSSLRMGLMLMTHRHISLLRTPPPCRFQPDGKWREWLRGGPKRSIKTVCMYPSRVHMASLCWTSLSPREHQKWSSRLPLIHTGVPAAMNHEVLTEIHSINQSLTTLAVPANGVSAAPSKLGQPAVRGTRETVLLRFVCI